MRRKSNKQRKTQYSILMWLIIALSVSPFLTVLVYYLAHALAEGG